MNTKGNRQRHGATIGGHDTGAYKSWQHMKGRCLRRTNQDYERYGGRGITIHPPWITSFAVFLIDMGPRPDGFQLERKDNNKGYSPDNCKWASHREQMNNTSQTVRLTLNGVTRNVTQWAAHLDISRKMLAARLRLGWTAERALTTPKMKGQYYARKH